MALDLMESEAEWAGDNSRNGVDRFLNASEPFPFEELLISFVRVGQRKLSGSTGVSYRLLAESAHAELERSLLRSLSMLSAETWYREFMIASAQAASPLNRTIAQAINPDDRTLYRQFVHDIRSGEFLKFFKTYPVLARQMAQTVDLWIEANDEFLTRLSADLPQIQHIFGDDRIPGTVTDIQTWLSDPHRGRRSVYALTFASGMKLVYKPKDLGMEEAYSLLLTWINEHGAPHLFHTLRVINRSSYGWVEYVEHLPCHSTEEARNYYRNAGMLVCLVYMLDGTDCHCENIIAHADSPVLVDTESLLSHHVEQLYQEEGSGAQMQAYEQIDNSVLRTGLLPNWLMGSDGSLAYDYTGLGGTAYQDLPMQMPKWLNVNTDRMEQVNIPIKTLPQSNIPVLNGKPLHLEDYTEDIVDGFRQMYGFLVEQRNALLAADSPLYHLAGQRTRFIYRPTRIYGTLLKELAHPQFMQEGITRSLHLELLARSFITLSISAQAPEAKPLFWPVLANEQRALEQGDIPFFSASACSRDLELHQGEILESCFSEPSFSHVLRRLQSLGDDDRERQIALIRGSLYSRVASDRSGSETISVGGGAVLDATIGPSFAQRMVAHARTIAEEIHTRSIRASDGSASWIVPHYLAQSERFQLQPASYDLYSGVSGIALFLAAIEKVGVDSSYRDLALGALQPLRHELARRGNLVAQRLGIGGAAGLGSVIYALVRIAQFLDDTSLIDDAWRAARLITPQRVKGDRQLDIIGGSAGCILGLLSLYRVSGDQDTLERAILCGRQLGEKRTVSSTGYRTWATVAGKHLAGFSHGAAGIAYALLQLATATRDSSFIEVAKEGIAYEASIFSAKAGNWPDLRQERQPGFMSSWCHGAPGIGLARLGSLPTFDTIPVRQDIEVALQTTERCALYWEDHLCCGNLGRAEVLLAGGLRLDRPELVEAAQLKAGMIASRAEQGKGFRLNALLPQEVYNPGLFQGRAGIGYELLRMAYPAQLPSVLLWE